MKYRISTFLCCIIAACVTLSCSDVDTPENPDHENGTVQPEPELVRFL